MNDLIKALAGIKGTAAHRSLVVLALIYLGHQLAQIERDVALIKYRIDRAHVACVVRTNAVVLMTSQVAK
jgi:hypothetical protein